MSDGKYHIFEPCCYSVSGSDFRQMLKQPVAIGKNVFHILNSIKNTPYEVIDIIDGKALEQIKTMDAIIAVSRLTINNTINFSISVVLKLFLKILL